MTTITRESAEIKSFITGFLSDPAHDNQSSNSLLTNVFRIALASLEAVSDERAAYELFMEKRFGGSVDRRRAKNGDGEYMAWDMAIGWIIWCHRAAMPQAGNFRENKNSSTSSPATPDGWISCSERMPEKGQNVLISVNFDSSLVEPLICSARYTGSTFRRGEATIKPGNGIEQATHWMPLSEPPQEVN
ncbi:TPA: DUF551 domain-containing protein [Escherichia coli]|nr:DUF551 domain-containing protein [Escherichia coli]